MLEIILVSLISSIVIFTVVYIIGQLVHDASIVDIFWGISFILTNGILLIWFRSSIFISEMSSILVYVYYSLIVLWGIRITVRIGKRNLGKGEDFRYDNWRKKWGKKYYIKMYFKNYLVQSIFNFVLSAPLYFLIYNNLSSEYVFNWYFLIGAIVTFLAIMYEGIADFQLDRFIFRKVSNKETSEVLKTGLWSQSRHPNYFGQQVIWYGFFAMAMSVNPTLGLISLISPLAITSLFYFISTPLLETKMAQSEAWVEYAKNTPRTIPYIGGKKIVKKNK